VLAVPRSMPMSAEKSPMTRESIELSLCNC
jgi:hypothetical protein